MSCCQSKCSVHITHLIVIDSNALMVNFRSMLQPLGAGHRSGHCKKCHNNLNWVDHNVGDFVVVAIELAVWACAKASTLDASAPVCSADMETRELLLGFLLKTLSWARGQKLPNVKGLKRSERSEWHQLRVSKPPKQCCMLQSKWCQKWSKSGTWRFIHCAMRWKDWGMPLHWVIWSVASSDCLPELSSSTVMFNLSHNFFVMQLETTNLAGCKIPWNLTCAFLNSHHKMFSFHHPLKLLRCVKTAIQWFWLWH